MKCIKFILGSTVYSKLIGFLIPNTLFFTFLPTVHFDMYLIFNLLLNSHCIYILLTLKRRVVIKQYLPPTTQVQRLNISHI